MLQKKLAKLLSAVFLIFLVIINTVIMMTSIKKIKYNGLKISMLFPVGLNVPGNNMFFMPIRSLLILK